MSSIEDLRIKLVREDIQKTRRAVKFFWVIILVGIIICAASIFFVQVGYNILVFLFGLFVTTTGAMGVVSNWQENKRLLKVLEGLLYEERTDEQL